jgi:hypothetical protein
MECPVPNTVDIALHGLSFIFKFAIHALAKCYLLLHANIYSEKQITLY